MHHYPHLKCPLITTPNFSTINQPKCPLLALQCNFVTSKRKELLFRKVKYLPRPISILSVSFHLRAVPLYPRTCQPPHLKHAGPYPNRALRMPWVPTALSTLMCVDKRLSSLLALCHPWNPDPNLECTKRDTMGQSLFAHFADCWSTSPNLLPSSVLPTPRCALHPSILLPHFCPFGRMCDAVLCSLCCLAHQNKKECNTTMVTSVRFFVFAILLCMFFAECVSPADRGV